MSEIKPIYLFADSQLLFWKEQEELFIKSILKHVSDPEPTAAYIGYSNGNQPEFYDIFVAVMESIGVQNCRMLSEECIEEDKKYLANASIILLAGGDPIKGWKTIKTTGVKETILKRFSEGAVLMGVSAGAVQLGMGTSELFDDQESKFVDLLQVIPFIISAHDESDEWRDLRQQVLTKGEHTKGLGIPFGSGFVYHPDHTVEPIKTNIVEVNLENKETRLNLLYPETDKNQDHVLQ